LWAIHNSKATIAFAPDSAYNSCARRIPLWTIEGLDLGSWRCAVNGGELVRRESVEAFALRFSPFGFRRDAMQFAYGLAEAGGVLALSGRGHNGEPDARGYYAVGEPLPGCDLRAAEGQIEFRPAGGQAWVGTGDLGYFHDGALVITGRAKEVLQSQGKLLSPNAIETAASRVPGVLSGVTAAFSVHNSSREQLVIAAEAAAEPGIAAERVVAQVRRAAQPAVGDAGIQVVLTPLGSLPRTGDGRLRRILARELYREGTLTQNGTNATVARKVTWLKNLPGIARMWVRTTSRRLDRQFRRWKATFAAGQPPLNAERARSVLNHLGHEAIIEGELQARTLVAVHRCGPLDPVVFAAFSRVPIHFAGDAVLIGVPRWLHASLRPLIVETEADLKRALEQGVVVQFPDNELGEPAARCRFRLPPFRVATSIVPAAVQQVRSATTIRLGKAMAPADEATATRELLRAALTRLRDAGTECRN
jgi:hypothetical protein